jgi:diguanylate cyclase (GGDEF)-like protein/PAS domain S-box-containing protein
MNSILSPGSTPSIPNLWRGLADRRGLAVLASPLWPFNYPMADSWFGLMSRLSFILLALLVWQLVRAYRRLDAVGRRAEMELRMQERRFHALIENCADGIILVNSPGIVLYASASAQRALGCGGEELVGRDAIACVYPEDREQAREFLLKLSESAGTTITTEFRCHRKDGRWFWVESTGTNLLGQPGIEAIVVNFRDIEARKRSEEQLKVLAATDPLTGLANYRQLIGDLDSELQRSDRTGRSFAVLWIDLDGLKQINDRFGHLVGSRALCRVAEVLRVHSRAMDTAARYGGDEFTLILPESDAEAAYIVANRISRHLAADREYPPISVSIGLATYPNDGNTIELLLDAADRQLYLVKAARKDAVLQATH